MAARALAPLLADPNEGVRLWAATHALEFAPERAEPVLKAIARGNGIPACTAEMALYKWRLGVLQF